MRGASFSKMWGITELVIIEEWEKVLILKSKFIFIVKLNCSQETTDDLKPIFRFSFKKEKTKSNLN